MPLMSEKEVLNLKLNCIPSVLLKGFASNLGIKKSGTKTDIIKRFFEARIATQTIDAFIKEATIRKIEDRKKRISDEDLKQELSKVTSFSWGVIQGELDRKIQAEYVREFVRYDELLRRVEENLYDAIKNYVVCSWYNHWTTVLIEEQISTHPKIVPTITAVKGIDIFFGGQPFDLKVTYLPRGYDPVNAINNPQQLAIRMYEGQGAQRFGADNRLFVILLDPDNPQESWKLKREFDLISRKITAFFNTETVSKNDEIIFTYKKKTYATVAKVLIVTG
ncbi:MAG TPA: hypothetical protein VMX79_03640 [bacterium]|nr:hypothetical protein [bacterium]